MIEALHKMPDVTKKVDIELLIGWLCQKLSKLERDDTGVNSLEQFDSKTPVEQLCLQEVVKQMQEAVPELWHLLSQLVAAKFNHGHDEISIESHLVAIISILAYTQVSRLCNNFPALLSLYCHSMSVKRRVLELLYNLDLCVSYHSLQKKHAELAEEEKINITSNFLAVVD